MIVFMHGGSCAWETGRDVFRARNSLREGGLSAVRQIPSYRLMPDHPAPGPRSSDVAAAFAWVYKEHVAQYGGDIKRIYLVGHSSGGHLAALLALDSERTWQKLDVPAGAIRDAAASISVRLVT